jgi:hypothetical protein
MTDSSNQVSSSIAMSHSLVGTMTFRMFDPQVHLAFKEPPHILSMRDIGFENVGVSPVAVTQPIQLSSSGAIEIMHTEIENPEIKRDCGFAIHIGIAQLRGYARKYAPFTYAAWIHPEVITIMFKLAGIGLVPWGDYKVAHINLSAVETEDEARAELSALHARKSLIHSDGVIDVGSSADDKPIVGWHTDSYPFVCVLMMSDCTNMVGGETPRRTANGDVIRVRGPIEGCVVIPQGRCITHQALHTLGAKERITAVTSWRPRSPSVQDDSELRTVRPVSGSNELYADFAEYRLDIMEQRTNRARAEMRTRRQAGGRFDTLGHKAFLQDSA